MENLSLIKIHVSHKDTGKPAVGYSIDIIELVNDNAEKITDSNGDIPPFHMDLNNYIYVDVFVRDSDDNIVAEADGQYPIKLPETIIQIEV